MPASGPAPATAPAAQQVLERGPLLRVFPSELCTGAGAFGRAEGAALLPDGDEAQGDRVHPPRMPRRRRS